MRLVTGPKVPRSPSYGFWSRGCSRHRGRRDFPLPFDNAPPTRWHPSSHAHTDHPQLASKTGFKVPIKDNWTKLAKMDDIDAHEHAVSFLLVYLSVPHPTFEWGFPRNDLRVCYDHRLTVFFYHTFALTRREKDDSCGWCVAE